MRNDTPAGNNAALRSEDHEQLEVAFVGSVGAPEDSDHEGVSQAANHFQLQLLEALRKWGLEVKIFSVRFRKFFPSGPLFVRGGRSSFSGFSIRYLPFLNHPLLQAPLLALQIVPKIVWWGRWTRRRGRRGVVLLYNLYPIPGLAVMLACRMGRVAPVVIAADIHVPGETRPDDLLHRLDFRMQSMALRRAAGIVGLTREVVEDLAPGAAFMVMEGAIPDERLLEIPISPLEKRSLTDPFIIMYAGQLSELKGIPLLLKAFRHTTDETLRLWIAGRGDCEEEIRLAASADPRITFWGYGAYDELLDLYGRTTILVNPHRTDLRSSRYMFPSKLIEYMAAGRPVISTPGAGVRESYFEYVDVIENESSELLAGAIVRMRKTQPEVLALKAKRARELVERERTWVRQAERVIQFMKKTRVGN